MQSEIKRLDFHVVTSFFQTLAKPLLDIIASKMLSVLIEIFMWNYSRCYKKIEFEYVQSMIGSQLVILIHHFTIYCRFYYYYLL